MNYLFHNTYKNAYPCPEDEYRLSLAAYYYVYSSPEQQQESRSFAEFHKTS